MCCGWVFKQNAQRFPKRDKFSSTAVKNKPLFKEWLVGIEKANLLKLYSQCQICSEHFEKFRALDTKLNHENVSRTSLCKQIV